MGFLLWFFHAPFSPTVVTFVQKTNFCYISKKGARCTIVHLHNKEQGGKSTLFFSSWTIRSPFHLHSVPRIQIWYYSNSAKDSVENLFREALLNFTQPALAIGLGGDTDFWAWRSWWRFVLHFFHQDEIFKTLKWCQICYAHLLQSQAPLCFVRKS